MIMGGPPRPPILYLLFRVSDLLNGRTGYWQQDFFKGGSLMKATMLVIGALALAMLDPRSAAAKDKKKPPRGMIESMQSLPCGVKEKGLSGLGAVWGSVGVTSVSSNEKLCPQYLFRTDDLEYHLRPKDTKHPVILPIGHEAEYRIHKDEIILKVP